MISEQAKKLGSALVAAKVMTQTQLDAAMHAVSEGHGPGLVINLLEEGFLTFKVFEKFVLMSLGVQSAIVAGRPPVQSAVDALGRDFLASHMVYPLGLRNVKGVETLALGMVDPLDKDIIGVVESKTGYHVVPVLISLPDFKESILKNLVGPEDAAATRSHVNQTNPTDTDASMSGKTVQPKPSWDHTSLNASSVSLERVAHAIPEKNKFREEILAKLDLEPLEAKLLKQESYTRESLFEQLKNLELAKLEKIYNSLSASAQIEALVAALVKAKAVKVKDLITYGAVAAVFHEETK